MTDQSCAICGDTEPFHTHNEGQRIEDYFTVGRGLSEFESALLWQRKAKKRAADLKQAKALAVRLPITNLMAALAGYDAQYSVRGIGEQHPDLPLGCVERVEALVREVRAVVESTRNGPDCGGDNTCDPPCSGCSK